MSFDRKYLIVVVCPRRPSDTFRWTYKYATFIKLFGQSAKSGHNKTKFRNELWKSLRLRRLTDIDVVVITVVENNRKQDKLSH